MPVRILIAGPRRNETMRELFDRLGGRAGGVLLVSIRQADLAVGFKIKTHTGREAVLAHITGASLYRAGKFKVNVEELDKAAEAIREAIQSREVVLIDEIGKMTLFSDKFREAVREAFESPKHVVASVQDKPHGFVDKIKALPGIVLEQNAAAAISRLTPDGRPL